jgi:hypothetical protein
MPLWGFTSFAVASLLWYGFWLVPVNADPPPDQEIVDVREMSVKERAELGERLIFGRVGGSEILGAIGKAQCSLCHGFQKGYRSDRAPNLFGITTRASKWLKDPRYHLGKPEERDTVQKEAFPGAGTATTPIEYIAESAVCPHCFVVSGFGVMGTDDRESPEPHLLKQPISLSIDDLIAVDTWLYVHDGQEPPSTDEIEKAYRKFIPESEWHRVAHPGGVAGYVQMLSGQIIKGDEPAEELFIKANCILCHIIPGVPGAVDMVVGPKLDMKTTAPKRIVDPDYKGKATNVREYIIESIVDPSVHVVKGFPDNMMPKDYRFKLSDEVLDKLVEYLSQMEEGKEPQKVR